MLSVQLDNVCVSAIEVSLKFMTIIKCFNSSKFFLILRIYIYIFIFCLKKKNLEIPFP